MLNILNRWVKKLGGILAIICLTIEEVASEAFILSHVGGPRVFCDIMLQ